MYSIENWDSGWRYCRIIPEETHHQTLFPSITRSLGAIIASPFHQQQDGHHCSKLTNWVAYIKSKGRVGCEAPDVRLPPWISAVVVVFLHEKVVLMGALGGPHLAGLSQPCLCLAAEVLAFRHSFIACCKKQGQQTPLMDSF